MQSNVVKMTSQSRHKDEKSQRDKGLQRLSEVSTVFKIISNAKTRNETSKHICRQLSLGCELL